MATPTTLLELATQGRDAAKQMVTDAQKRLAETQQNLADATAELAKANKDLAGLKGQEDALRSRLSAVPTREDGEALLADLEQIIIRGRAAQDAAIRAGSKLKSAQAESAGAQAALAASSARLAAAESELAQATKADKQRAALKDALTKPPLASINTDADAALKAAPWLAAKKRIEGDNAAALKGEIPPVLLARARSRRDKETGRISQAQTDATAAEDAALDERDANGGLEGKAIKQWVLFQRAEAAVKDFAANAKAQFDQATNLTAQVADASNAPLTPEQKARLFDATLQAKRDAAFAAESGRDDTRTALDDAQIKLNAEELKAIAAGSNPDDVQAVKDAKAALEEAKTNLKDTDDVWEAQERDRDEKLGLVAEKENALALAIQAAVAAKQDPDTDGNVANARAALKTAQDNLATAEEDYEGSSHGILHSWEAAVPDTTWQLLNSFERAKTIFVALKSANPAVLKTALDTAEQNYVAARLKANSRAGVFETLTARQNSSAAQRQIANDAASLRLFSALRGDN